MKIFFVEVKPVHCSGPNSEVGTLYSQIRLVFGLLRFIRLIILRLYLTNLIHVRLIKYVYLSVFLLTV